MSNCSNQSSRNFFKRHFNQADEPKKEEYLENEVVRATHAVLLWAFDDPSAFEDRRGRKVLADAALTLMQIFPELIYKGTMYRTLDFRYLPPKDVSVSDVRLLRIIKAHTRSAIASWSTTKQFFRGNDVHLVVGVQQEGEGLNVEKMFQGGENEVLAPYNATVRIVARF